MAEMASSRLRFLQPQPQSLPFSACGISAFIARALRALGPPVAVRSVLVSARLPWTDIAFRRASATAREVGPDWTDDAKMRVRGLTGAAAATGAGAGRTSVAVFVSTRVRSGLVPEIAPLPPLDKALRLASAIALVLWLCAMMFPVKVVFTHQIPVHTRCLVD
jgi:hypothetical protein